FLSRRATFRVSPAGALVYQRVQENPQIAPHNQRNLVPPVERHPGRVCSRRAGEVVQTLAGREREVGVAPAVAHEDGQAAKALTFALPGLAPDPRGREHYEAVRPDRAMQDRVASEHASLREAADDEL